MEEKSHWAMGRRGDSPSSFSWGQPTGPVNKHKSARWGSMTWQADSASSCGSASSSRHIRQQYEIPLSTGWNKLLTLSQGNILFCFSTCVRVLPIIGFRHGPERGDQVLWMRRWLMSPASETLPEELVLGCFHFFHYCLKTMFMLRILGNYI